MHAFYPSVHIRVHHHSLLDFLLIDASRMYGNPAFDGAVNHLVDRLLEAAAHRGRREADTALTQPLSLSG
jgi:streptomycin 6-kinase